MDKGRKFFIIVVRVRRTRVVYRRSGPGTRAVLESDRLDTEKEKYFR